MTQKRGDALRAAGCGIASPAELLQAMGLPHLIDKLKNGRVDDEVAAELSKETKMSAQFWLNVQTSYDG